MSEYRQASERSDETPPPQGPVVWLCSRKGRPELLCYVLSGSAFGARYRASLPDALNCEPSQIDVKIEQPINDVVLIEGT